MFAQINKRLKFNVKMSQLFEIYDDKKSKQESIGYIKKASDKGHTDAIYKLGLILIDDIGIEHERD